MLQEKAENKEYPGARNKGGIYKTIALTGTNCETPCGAALWSHDQPEAIMELFPPGGEGGGEKRAYQP